jgi:hypothetical protein
MAGGRPDRDSPQLYLTAVGTCRPPSRTAARPALNHPMAQFRSRGNAEGAEDCDEFSASSASPREPRFSPARRYGVAVAAVSDEYGEHPAALQARTR